MLIISIIFQAVRNRDDAKNFILEMARYPEVKVRRKQDLRKWRLWDGVQSHF